MAAVTVLRELRRVIELAVRGLGTENTVSTNRCTRAVKTEEEISER
jgi:uncharacterized protein (UPF0147 family)